MPKCECGRPAEWAGEYCQDCWEDYTNNNYWEQIKKLNKEFIDNDAP